MTFKEMIEKDLANCSEFGGICKHTVNGAVELLPYLCFDEHTKVVLEKDEHSGVEASVPAITIQTAKAKSINHKSLLEIDEKIYSVIEKDMQKDSTTIIYLEKQND